MFEENGRVGRCGLWFYAFFPTYWINICYQGWEEFTQSHLEKTPEELFPKHENKFCS